jgi:hypothetical protein
MTTPLNELWKGDISEWKGQQGVKYRNLVDRVNANRLSQWKYRETETGREAKERYNNSREKQLYNREYYKDNRRDLLDKTGAYYFKRGRFKRLVNMYGTSDEIQGRINKIEQQNQEKINERKKKKFEMVKKLEKENKPIFYGWKGWSSWKDASLGRRELTYLGKTSDLEDRLDKIKDAEKKIKETSQK